MNATVGKLYMQLLLEQSTAISSNLDISLQHPQSDPANSKNLYELQDSQ